MMATLKHGTRIEIAGIDMAFKRTWEPATIVRPRKENLPLPGPGWHIIKFADGGKLCCHEDGFRVIDNRN